MGGLLAGRGRAADGMHDSYQLLDQSNHLESKDLQNGKGY